MISTEIIFEPKSKDPVHQTVKINRFSFVLLPRFTMSTTLNFQKIKNLQ